MTSTLKGIFPSPKPHSRKNFIHENVRNLRKMEQCFHVKKENDDQQKFGRPQRLDKYHKTTAKVNTNLYETKQDENEAQVTDGNEDEYPQHLRHKFSSPVLNNRHAGSTKKPVKAFSKNNSIKSGEYDRNNSKKGAKVSQQKRLSDSNLGKNKNKEIENILSPASRVMYRNQGIQTLDEEHLSNLYADGVIRYSTKRNQKSEKSSKNESSQKVWENDKYESQSPPLDRGDNFAADATDPCDRRYLESSPSPEETNYVKLNKQRLSVANKIATQLNNGVLPPSYQKGVVPKYLKERKEAYEKEQKEKAAAYHPDCPEGHVPLPDDERKETLRMLKKNYQDYVKELNMIPIKSDTLRAQRKKMEIEKQLTKLEEGIKVFSKPKVYVKINA